MGCAKKQLTANDMPHIALVDDLEKLVAELDIVIAEENRLLLLLLKSLKGSLSGYWPREFSPDEIEYFEQYPNRKPSKFEFYDLKIKVNGFHLLLKRQLQPTGSECLVARLYRAIYHPLRRQKFESIVISQTWRTVRDSVSISEIVATVQASLNAKVAASKKENLEELTAKISALGE